MAQAARDQNRVPTLLGVDSSTFLTPTTAAVTSNHEVLVYVNNNSSGAIMGRVNIFDTNNTNGANVTSNNELVVGNGKTLTTVTGSASATFTIVAADASKKIKVYSLSLITASTTAVTVTFKSGAAGTALATYPLQAITGTNFGITENITVPGILFQTAAATLLEMSFSAAQSVTYNLRYWVEA